MGRELAALPRLKNPTAGHGPRMADVRVKQALVFVAAECRRGGGAMQLQMQSAHVSTWRELTRLEQTAAANAQHDSGSEWQAHVFLRCS